MHTQLRLTFVCKIGGKRYLLRTALRTMRDSPYTALKPFCAQAFCAHATRCYWTFSVCASALTAMEKQKPIAQIGFGTDRLRLSALIHARAPERGFSTRDYIGLDCGVLRNLFEVTSTNAVDQLGLLWLQKSIFFMQSVAAVFKRSMMLCLLMVSCFIYILRVACHEL